MDDHKLNLRLFDGEEAAGAPAASEDQAAPASGEGAQPTAQGEENTQSPEEIAAEFDSLIKGKYKDLYNQRVQGAIKDRFKKHDGIEKQIKQMQKTLSLIGQRYGTEDATELYDKISKDGSLFEAQALEAGMSEQAYIEKQRMEFENKQLLAEIERRDQEAKNAEIINGWKAAEANLKQVYPDFVLDNEMANPKFVELLTRGVDMRTCFEVIHHDEVMNGLAQRTASLAVEKQAAASKAAVRPNEGGLNTQSGISSHIDISKSTKEERKRLAERARRGEDIAL